VSGHTPWSEIPQKRNLRLDAYPLMIPLPWKLAEFKSTLKVEAVDDSHWRLLDRFIYDSDVAGERIIVPAGYVTDFASVPRIPIAYLLFGGRANAAATIHDWLYTTGIFPKCVADGVFYEAMRASGLRWDRAWWMWLGVAWGGGRAWRVCRANSNPNLFGLRFTRRLT
jgi:hypothetical protein